MSVGLVQFIPKVRSVSFPRFSHGIEKVLACSNNKEKINLPNLAKQNLIVAVVSFPANNLVFVCSCPMRKWSL